MWYDELGGMWEEVVEAYFKVQSQVLPGGLRKIVKNLTFDS
jgi:hypothetical protein